ncbi:MAG: SusF/SusE family outer membrane protein [Paludibacter sp.]
MKKNLHLVLIALFTINALTAQNPMCMIGDATKYGWDKDKSSPLTQDGVSPSKFYYNAWLNAGSFKFLMQNSDWVPSWNKGATETTVVKRSTNADPDISFSVTTAGNYSLVLDTAALSLSMTPMVETTPIPFNTIFMVGDATPNGWDLGKATELVKAIGNPFEFSYTGPLAVGDFKFPVNRNWGWNQDFFIKVSDTQMQLVSGGDVKWNITEAANYKVTINISTSVINIQKNPTSANFTTLDETSRIVSTVVKDEILLSSNQKQQYKIYNTAGISSLMGVSDNGSINVSGLKSGIYLLSIENKSFKFIKH